MAERLTRTGGPGGAVAAPAVRGRKGGKAGSGGRTPVESPDSLFADSVARIVDVVSEGEIGGWADPDNPRRCILFDGTPLENADGSLNFEGVDFELRTGSADQEAVAGFEAVESEHSVGVTVEQALPVTRSVTDADTDAVRITLGVGGFSDLDSASGDLRPTSVEMAIEMQVGAAAFEEVTRVTISGKTSSGYQRQVRVELPELRPVQLRVRRITADSNRSSLQNAVAWQTYTEIIDAKLAYPHTAYVALTIPAQAFGGRLPVRTYKLAGVKCLAPANRDAETREYDEAEIWDGSLTRVAHDNPAWALYTALLEERWGLGEYLGAAEPDKWAFYQLGKYCDELVPDGAGGYEPRFTLNGALSTREQAFDVIQKLGSVMRALTIWREGAIHVAADMPADPVKLVTNANVQGGRFEYAGTGMTARHTAGSAAYRHREDSFALKRSLSWDDPALVARYGWRETELTLPMTASRGEALRQLKWAIDTDTTQRETVTYGCGLDHAGLRPGDVVLIADKHRAGWRLGGRLREIEAARLRLDQAVTLSASESYTLAVAKRDGSFAELPVAVGLSGSVEWVQTVGPHGLDAELKPGAVFVLMQTSAPPRAFRILEIANDAPPYAVTAVEHDPDKYARVEQGLRLETDPPYILTPSGAMPPPVAIVASELLYRDGSAVRAALDVSVSAPADPRVAALELSMKAPGADAWSSLGLQVSPLWRVQNAEPGLYRFRARAFDALQRAGAWYEAEHIAQALLAPPETVSGLSVSVNGGQATLRWQAVADLDVAAYRIRHTGDEAGTWPAAQDVATVPAPATSAVMPALPGRWLIKAIDMSGIESAAAASAILSSALLDGLNVVELVEGGDAAGGVWDGEGSGADDVEGDVSLISAALVKDWGLVKDVGLIATFGGLAESGTFTLAEVVDLGDVYACRVSATLAASGARLDNLVANWGLVADVGLVSGAAPEAWRASVEIRTTDDDPAGSPTWSAWAEMVAGDVTARAFEFRVALARFAPLVTPRVSSVEITVDMPDRVAGADAVTVPSGGLRVSYAPAFRARPALAVDAHGLSAGDRKAVTNADATGFDVQFFDAGGSPVERVVDWIAKGYGRKI
jgi:predicted phage tail protein